MKSFRFKRHFANWEMSEYQAQLSKWCKEHLSDGFVVDYFQTQAYSYKIRKEQFVLQVSINKEEDQIFFLLNFGSEVFVC